mmetsp:Transcript_86467/g.207092  ORF Transcript_86467/g.207092 Transcript_86467/m.207092 type:complete len:228 (-) Transcript_86467:199-882(-)
MEKSRHHEGQEPCSTPGPSRGTGQRNEEGALHQPVDHEVPSSAPELAKRHREEQRRLHGIHSVDAKEGQQETVHEHCCGQGTVDVQGLQVDCRLCLGEAQKRHRGCICPRLQERREAGGLSDAEHNGTQKHMLRDAEQELRNKPVRRSLQPSCPVEEHFRRRGKVDYEVPEAQVEALWAGAQEELQPPEACDDAKEGEGEVRHSGSPGPQPGEHEERSHPEGNAEKP